MRKIVYGLIISVCLGANLYADNSKKIELYSDIYQNDKEAIYCTCSIVIKPPKDSHSEYSAVERISWAIFGENGRKSVKLFEEGDCATFNGVIKKNNMELVRRTYNDSVVKTLYIYVNAKQ